MTAKPTMQMYTFVQDAYDFFNDRLFNGQLPPCLLTLQRESNAMGYFSSNRWQRGKGKETVHEIALNPSFFITHRPLELMQTLVHEMVHLWQHEFGTPSHRSYHNKEWADKMESIGLMPSSTGEPGGKRTGQRMSDYPIKDGAFYLQCVVFSQMGYKLPFYDRYAKTESTQVRIITQMDEAVLEAVYSAVHQVSEEGQGVTVPMADNGLPEEPEAENTDTGTEEGAGVDADTYAAAEASLMQPFSEQFDIEVAELTESREKEAAAKRKSVYLCQSCGDRAWGKPSLDLRCGKCKIAFVKLDTASSDLLMKKEDMGQYETVAG